MFRLIFTAMWLVVALSCQAQQNQPKLKTDNWPDSAFAYRPFTIYHHHFNPDTSQYYVLFKVAVPTSFKLYGDMFLRITPGLEDTIQVNTRLFQKADSLQVADYFGSIPVYPNPDFDSAWISLPPDSIPTPLTQTQLSAWSDFRDLQRLHKQLVDVQLPENPFGFQSPGDWHGKYTIVYNWYYGCPPCMAIKPVLDSFYARWHGDPEVQFVAFTPDTIIAYTDTANVYSIAPAWARVTRETDSGSVRIFPRHDYFSAWPQIGESNEILKQWGVSSYPTFYFLDKEGIIRNLNRGGPTQASESTTRLYIQILETMLQNLRENY
jgi:thiol-disulfide isomerase/thioredoxin